jgi:hypothetical protein
MSLGLLFAANVLHAVDASVSDPYVSFSSGPTAVGLYVEGTNGYYSWDMFGYPGTVASVEDVTHVTYMDMLAEDGGAVGNGSVQATLTVPNGATATVSYMTYKDPVSNQVYVNAGGTTTTDNNAYGSVVLYPGTYDLEVDCVSFGGTAVADINVVVNY